jgi:hypothetical protein
MNTTTSTNDAPNGWLLLMIAVLAALMYVLFTWNPYNL